MALKMTNIYLFYINTWGGEGFYKATTLLYGNLPIVGRFGPHKLQKPRGHCI